MTHTGHPEYAAHARTAETLARQSLDWLLTTAEPAEGEALSWDAIPGTEHGPLAPSLFHGTLGVVLALYEGHRHFGDDRYREAAVRAARTVAAGLDAWTGSSLYNGVGGAALILREIADDFGDDELAGYADHALSLVRDRFDGQSWPGQDSTAYDLLIGSAGTALALLRLGDLETAVKVAESFASISHRTGHGLVWDSWTNPKAVLHHFAHGTLGFSYALAVIGQAAGREDLTAAGLAGVADVISRNEADDDGFFVPRCDPAPPEDSRAEPYGYGWCAGPAGDAQLFRLLHQQTGHPEWRSYVDRCWHTIRTSGLPQRIRPGFWDNHGACCGTASVLRTACDRIVEQNDGADFAAVLVDSLAEHAITDETGTRWSNHEHRDEQPDLPPRTGWAHGAAGIIRELLRYSRIVDGRDQAYALRMPDHPEARA